jgi:hypothetical protein
MLFPLITDGKNGCTAMTGPSSVSRPSQLDVKGIEIVSQVACLTRKIELIRMSFSPAFPYTAVLETIEGFRKSLMLDFCLPLFGRVSSAKVAPHCRTPS